VFYFNLDEIASETSLSFDEAKQKEKIIMDCASVMYAAATDSVSLSLFLPHVKLILSFYEVKLSPSLLLCTDVAPSNRYAASAGRY